MYTRYYTDMLCMTLWPLESFISLVSPARRLGDLIANTRVEKADKEDPMSIFEDLKKIKLTHVAMWTFLISSGYLGILWYVMDRLVNL